MNGKVRAWFGRYGPAEVGAIAGVLLAALTVAPFGVSVATAFAGSLGDGVGFYTVLFVRDLRRRPGPPRGRAVGATMRDLLVEFGPAEVLDTLLVRPLAMYLAARAIGQATAGVVAGKIAADVVFYSLAILAYELRKHLARRPHVRARGSARVHSGRAPQRPDPSARPEEVATQVIDLVSVPTAPIRFAEAPPTGPRR